MLSSLIKNRPLCIALTIGSSIYLAFHLAGISLMNCPVDQLFHVRCPGCGLTRSVTALLHGDLVTSFQLHAFAIPMLIIFSLIGIACFLPEKPLDKLALIIAKTEKLTHWPYVLLLGLIVYSLTREILTL